MASLTFPAPLPYDRYQAVLTTAVADLAGNRLGSNYLWQFRVADAVFWASQNPGSWFDPGNWTSGAVPGPADNVIIDAPVNVTINGGTVRGRTVTQSQGARLIFTGDGNNRLDGVVVNGDLDVGLSVNGAQVTIANGLVLNGTAHLGNPTNRLAGDNAF